MFFNVFMVAILKSPLHGLVSKGTVLLTFKGRKSGKQYEVPVNYMLDGEDLLVTSLKERTWWRNLKGGEPLLILLAGEKYTATAQVFEQPIEIMPHLKRYLELTPRTAKYFSVRLHEDGTLNEDDLAQAAETRVIIKISKTNS